MRKFIFKIIEPSDGGNKLNRIYDFIMMGTIIVSIVPLAFKTSNALFVWIGNISVSIFIIDYILRFITADLKLEKSIGSFFLYPITPMAIIDLLSILPSLTVLNNGFKLLSSLDCCAHLKYYEPLSF